ncbi:MAG: hypothetical protein ACXVJJ_07520 [Halobacteriota archaeon]
MTAVRTVTALSSIAKGDERASHCPTRVPLRLSAYSCLGSNYVKRENASYVVVDRHPDARLRSEGDMLAALIFLAWQMLRAFSFLPLGILTLTHVQITRDIAKKRG